MKSDKQSEAPPKAKPKPAAAKEESIVISFRLSRAKYEPYRLPVLKSGLSRSAFFRKMFSDNEFKVVISEKKNSTEDYTKYLHLVNKISNNLNQLARLLNGAEKSGNATPQQYTKGLNDLNTIRILLLNKLGTKE